MSSMDHYVTIEMGDRFITACYGTRSHIGGDVIGTTDEAPGLESGVYRLVKVSDSTSGEDFPES